jgi:hypothetical protein
VLLEIMIGFASTIVEVLLNDRDERETAWTTMLRQELSLLKFWHFTHEHKRREEMYGQCCNSSWLRRQLAGSLW